MAYWKHRELQRGYVSYEPRKRALIEDGVFEAPDDATIEARLEEAGHERLGDEPPEPEPEADEDQVTPPPERSVANLTGVGPKTMQELADEGITTVGELADADPDVVGEALVETAQAYLDEPPEPEDEA